MNTEEAIKNLFSDTPKIGVSEVLLKQAFYKESKETEDFNRCNYSSTVRYERSKNNY